MNNRHIKLMTNHAICATSAETLTTKHYRNQFIMMLQIFLDIFNPKKGAWLNKVDEPSSSLSLSNKRTCSWLKLKQLFCLSRKELTRLLINVRCKIQFLRKAEKTRKRGWLIKRAKNEFNVNPYKAGKNLDPKCYCSLKVDQETLDQYKSNIMDNNYHIPFGNLEGLPPGPRLLINLKNIIKALFL